jgi:hypothetical protein
VGALTDALGFLLAAEGLLTTSNAGSLTFLAPIVYLPQKAANISYIIFKDRSVGLLFNATRIQSSLDSPFIRPSTRIFPNTFWSVSNNIKAILMPE